MRITIFLCLLLFQTFPNPEQQLVENLIIDYITSKPVYGKDKKYYVSEVLDSVYIQRYQRVLNQQNDLIYKSLTLNQKELIQDLLKLRNPTPFEIDKLTNQAKFKIRSLNEIDRDDWESSSIKVSRVAFSQDGNEACFILEYVCGPKCGEGVLIFAQKEDESWKIQIRKNLWIA